jgi:hypothetical protein
MIGLDMLRRDIENAGYGLAWDNMVDYTESAANTFALNDAPTGVPRAIVSQNNAAFNGSDYLVIKAVNVARNDACEKWTYVRQSNVARKWYPPTEVLNNGDRVIVLSPRDKFTRPLVTDSGTFYTTYTHVTGTGNDSLANNAFAPADEYDTFIVHGINDSTAGNPVRPFNRADYYIAVPTAPDTLPSRCAPNTGILYKATMNHNANGTLDAQPLLDCVADMQVIYGLDTNNDGIVDAYNDVITGVAWTAQQIRTQVREVRVYILTHEGERDRNYTHPTAAMTVGEFGLGSNINLGTNLNYRWKVYRLTTKPLNLN